MDLREIDENVLRRQLMQHLQLSLEKNNRATGWMHTGVLQEALVGPLSLKKHDSNHVEGIWKRHLPKTF